MQPTKARKGKTVKRLYKGRKGESMEGVKRYGRIVFHYGCITRKGKEKNPPYFVSSPKGRITGRGVFLTNSKKNVLPDMKSIFCKQKRVHHHKDVMTKNEEWQLQIPDTETEKPNYAANKI